VLDAWCPQLTLAPVHTPGSPPLCTPLVPAASSSSSSSLATDPAEVRASVREASLRMLGLLAQRDARRSFCEPASWVIAELRYSELYKDVKEKTARAEKLLWSMPWAVPFERRVNIFREFVAAEKAALPNEALPEHMRGHHIKVRRESLLEDGYVQMGSLSAEKLKGTIRVEFISGLGLAEAGIDRTGVFKEFLEDTLARGFDPDRGLFTHTQQQQLYPSPTSAQAEPQVRPPRVETLTLTLTLTLTAGEGS
jgi:hypothetical protein